MPRTAPQDRTQVLPFAGASDLHLRIARSFALITDWNAALGGQFPLIDVLKILVKQTEARNIAIYRLHDDRAHPIVTAARAHDNTRVELSSGAIARYLRDHHADALDPGSIWRLHELRKEPAFENTAGAREWAARSEICEVSLVVLETNDGQIDLIEMIFDTPPRPSPELPVSIVTQAMADAWSMRAPGLITRLIRTYGRSRTRPDQGSALLSAQNPYGLSRSERRVAQMLGGGTKARDIAESLGISIPTVRSHLRNLYAKTETSGQVELVNLINGARGET